MCNATESIQPSDNEVASVGEDSFSDVRLQDKETQNKRETADRSVWQRVSTCIQDNEFLFLILCAICLARLYPKLGAVYVLPEITATWLAVIFIFLLSGLGLRTAEFAQAFTRYHFNAFVQIFNLLFVSSVVYGLSRILLQTGILDGRLADGTVICACLPMSINLVIILSKVSDGDDAAAVFNTAFGNLLGVFLSPLLILMYLGSSNVSDMGIVFYKLAIRVVLPTIVGQMLRKVESIATFCDEHKALLKRGQQYTLGFIVYTVFCTTFYKDQKSVLANVFLMIAFQLVMLLTFTITAWYMLKLLFRDEPRMRVMGLFGCTHKTVAMGFPLITTMYEQDPNVGLYTLPLLVWYPTQLILGTILAPYLRKFVAEEEERLSLENDSEEEEDDDDIEKTIVKSVAEGRSLQFLTVQDGLQQVKRRKSDPF